MVFGLHERILMDIEVQRDLFSPGGSCFTPDALDALKQIYRLFRWARAENVPVVSTVLRVRPHRIGPLAKKPHCVDGTAGEEKLPGTVLPNRINLGLRNTTDLPGDLFDRYEQVIFEKRQTDILDHARAERLFTELSGSTLVLCGAGLAKGIAQAAIGLRTRGFGVVVAKDAVLDLGDPATPMARSRMEAKGVIFAETSEIVAPTPRKRLVPMRESTAMPAEELAPAKR